MLARELAEILLQNPDKEVHFATGDGGNVGAHSIDEHFHWEIPLHIAQRWLREVKNCYVGVEVFVHNLDMNNIYYTYNWIVYLYGDRYSGSDIDTTRYYEVSQEYGIKKALEIILEEGE